MPSETNPTICTKCRHLDDRGEGFKNSPHLWHCSKSAEELYSFVIGKTYTKTPKYCSNVNEDGNCPDYQEADGD